MNKVVVLVIFNHRYDENILILDRMYKSRFSNVYYIVPFYDGNREDVIPVYSRSIFFESYIAQAYRHIANKEFKHYLFVADDMILNPSINENSYQSFFQVEDNQSYIPDLIPLDKIKNFWIGSLFAFVYKRNQKYVEIANELPSYEIALKKMNDQEITISPLSRNALFHEIAIKINSIREKARLLLRIVTFIRHPFKRFYKLDYPMVASYSDIVLVDSSSIKKFCHYCGVFGASSLFVEVAIPTALVLSSNKKIKIEREMERGGDSYWSSKNEIFCKSEDFTYDKLEEKFVNLDDLIERFPDKSLYLHPVKLSKWLKKITKR